MKTQQQKIGEKGEKLAVKFLKKKKYKIMDRNFHAGRYGELDIVAKDKDELVFVEVKTKTDEQFGSPEEEFTYQKKRKMYRAIQNYLFKKYLTDKEWRADLIAIEITNNKPEIRHYENVGL
jgi:putative endonuclease